MSAAASAVTGTNHPGNASANTVIETVVHAAKNHRTDRAICRVMTEAAIGHLVSSMGLQYRLP